MADLDRPRSFIERYVIERATHFRAGFEKEDAWKAAQDGRSIYGMIGDAAKGVEQAQETGSIVGVSGASPLGPPNPPVKYPRQGACPPTVQYPMKRAPDTLVQVSESFLRKALKW